MTTFLLLIVLFSIIHFVYESIIGPSLRMSLRYRLFALRDSLRRLSIENRISSEEFNALHDGINFLIPRLPQVSISLTLGMEKAVKSDPELMNKAKKQDEMIDNSGKHELVTIRDSTARIFFEALIVNSGAWLVYIIPIAVVCATSAQVIKSLSRLLSIPAYKADKLFPIDDRMPATS